MAEKRKRGGDNDIDLLELGSSGSLSAGPLAKTEAQFMAGSLDLFEVAPMEEVMLWHRDAVYFPQGSLNDSGPYQFNIPAESSMMIDASSIRLEGRVQIQKIDDNGAVGKMGDDKVAFLCNMWPHALFKSIEVSFATLQPHLNCL